MAIFHIHCVRWMELPKGGQVISPKGGQRITPNGGQRITGKGGHFSWVKIQCFSL